VDFLFCFNVVIKNKFQVRTFLFPQSRGGWIFQKNFPYVSLFNYVLTNLKEVGLLDKLMKKQLELIKAGDTCEVSSFQAIDFGNVVLAFIMLAIGIVVSLVLLGVENLKRFI
jgi:hypothetical protein